MVLAMLQKQLLLNFSKRIFCLSLLILFIFIGKQYFFKIISRSCRHQWLSIFQHLNYCFHFMNSSFGTLSSSTYT